MKMKKDELNEIVERIANRVIDKVLNAIGKSAEEPEYITSAQAARILGISDSYLRVIKDRFTTKKIGNNRQGRVLFRKDTLLKEYERAR